MKSSILVFSLLFILLFGLVSGAFAHCQIPCGIYGDEDRFTTMLEDVTTLRKSVAKINELSTAEKPDYNQLVRWVNNKETHADKISDVVLKYFLAQRIKESRPHYTEELIALHKIITGAMKVKQSADPEKVDALEKAVKDFESLYLHDH